VKKRIFLSLFILLAIWDSQSWAKAEEVVLVANSHAGTISVIDANKMQAKCQWNVIPDIKERKAEWSLLHRLVNWYADFTFADDMALSKDYETLYVSRGSVSDIAAFDIATKKLLWRVPIEGFRSDHIIISNDGKRLYASAVSHSEVEVIDLESHAVIGKIPTGSQPHGLNLSPDGERLYIGEKVGGAITVADTRSLRVIKRIPMGAGVRPFLIMPGEKELYVQLSNYLGFVVYNLEDGKVTRTVALPQNEKSDSYHGEYPKQAAHHGLVLSTDAQHLCIAGTAANYVALVANPNMSTEAIIPVGEQPNWAINSLDGKYCYVSSRGSNTVSVISYEDKTEVKRIPVGNYPQRMIAVQLPSACDGL